MFSLQIKPLLRYHCLFWFIIFSLSVFSWTLDFLIWRKPDTLHYLGVSFISEAATMLVTGALLVWSQYKINQHNFAIWHLVLAALLLTCIYIPLENALWLITMKNERFDLRFLISNLDSHTLAFFVWTALYLAYILNQQRHFRMAESARLSQKIQQLELQALRHQLNPHFTFNALNSVCALIEAERFEDAELMSEQLASFLRYSLSSSPDSLVQLADELAAIEAYLALQKTRFGNKLKVDWKIDQNVRQHLIPALLLQPLVENAIKYAVATQQQGATITIAGQQHNGQLCLQVEDDGPGEHAITQLGQSSGVGLTNIKNRLNQHFGTAASLVVQAKQRGFLVCIQLPLQGVTA
ncbi:Putative signal transduction protein with a C-terminal ATPase domain protein [Rheinheimera sp. A13L]|uniref:sensor histidine kinase n=1 Tax=Rheinheimera sp. A13L TaxID=506534 RepID=UPI0002124CB2|nr:sensor histidine kinase [Rheinheimera sp. A13L]EGM76161.1 Putative signal transduction protein with a C-terminal ATPase domain protein [Rheinheimera sp. A13L]